MAAHLNKYRKLMPALALLFELADLAARGSVSFVSSTSRQTQKIGLAQAAKAAGWCDYLESHARRVYSCVANPHHRNAVELLDRIKGKKIAVSGIFSSRELLRKGWAGFDNPEKVKNTCELLADAGWVRELRPTRSAGGGRPAQEWEVHPEACR